MSVNVPSGSPVLMLTARGGTGNTDFLLTDPEGEYWLYYDFASGSYETIAVDSPMGGNWLITVFATTPLSKVNVTASTPIPRLLSPTGTTEPFNGEVSSQTFFRIAVPTGASSLRVETTAASGDFDLVMRRQRVPICQSFFFEIGFCFFDRPYGSFRFFNPNETITIANPQTGDWYLNLTSAYGYSSATITTRLDIRPTLLLSSNTMRFTSAVGGSSPAAQTVRVTNASGTSYTWTAAVSAGANWLTLSSTSGNSDTNVSLTVNPANLAPGAYNATVTFASTGLALSPQVLNVTYVVSVRPAISAALTALNFSSAPGSNPAVQRLAFTNTGGGTLEWTATAATTTGGNWLTLDQQRGTGNATLQVIVRAGTLAPGTYQGTITLAATDAAPVTVRVTYVVAVPFTVVADNLRAAASPQLGRSVSPGDLLVIDGTGFNPAEAASYQVAVNGVNARVVQVTPTAVRFLVPFEIQGAEARIVVSVLGFAAPPIVRELTAQSPSLFSVLDNGVGAGRILRADGSLVSRAAPLQPEEAVSILASGLGAVNASGETLATVKVFVEGAEARVVSAALEPDQPGVYRVRVVMPSVIAAKFPKVVMQSAAGDSQSNEVSAGGPSLLNVTPAPVPRGADAAISIRGWDLPEGAAVKIGEETIAGELIAPEAGSILQTLRVTIPGRLLASAGELMITVINPAAADEPPSNAIPLRVQ